MTYRFAFGVSEYRPYGGMQRTMVRIAKLCAERGHHVDIYTCAWSGPEIPELNVHTLDDRYYTNHGQSNVLGARLAEIVREDGGYDCVVGFSKLPNLDVYYGGDPCFAEKVANEKPGWIRILPRYRNYLRLERSVFAEGLDTEILLIAHQEQAHFMRHYGTEPGRFHQMPPGINRDGLMEIAEKADPAAIYAELGIPETDFVILCVGSWFRPKGIDRAIRALASLPRELIDETRLVVVGDGRPEVYKRLAAKLGVGERVMFTGGRPDVAAFYLAADILMHPAYSENTGTIIVEAMIFGLPVHVTEVCGFASHVRQANAGLVCPQPFSQEIFDQQLFQIRTSHESRKEWSDNGRRYCEENDLYSLIEKALDVLESRAERNRRNAS